MTREQWLASTNDVKGKFFEFVIQALIDAHCPKDGCAIDIGANWGSHTHVMLEEVGPGGRVLAFEPDPELAARLTGWQARFPNLSVFPIALSDHEGTAQFTVRRKPGTTRST